MNDRADIDASAGRGEGPAAAGADPAHTARARSLYPIPLRADRSGPDGGAGDPMASVRQAWIPEQMEVRVRQSPQPRREWPRGPVVMLAALALVLIGSALYLSASEGRLPFDRGETSATDDAEVANGSEEDADAWTEEAGVAPEAQGGTAGESEDGPVEEQDESGDQEVVGDADDTTESSVADGSTAETAVDAAVPTVSGASVAGRLTEDGIALVGAVSSQPELDGLVERLDVLAGPGGLDASEVTVDPGSPPVNEFALTVPDQIGFSVNSDVIEAGFLPILDRVVALLQSDQTLSLVVRGHTDARGVDFENLALSQRRAEAVVAYLVEAGVNSFRLEPMGRGSSEPTASNETSDGRAQNRRIEFTVFGLAG